MGSTMTSTGTIQEARNLQTAWVMLFPEIAAPALRQFVLWTLKYGEDALGKCLVRVAVRYDRSPESFKEDGLSRYLTSLLAATEQ